MKERFFQFKKFGLSHSRSAHKIGVDGVLLGAWADVCGARGILDAGCGCGLIAIMCAQRNVDAQITGIDIDAASAEEARENAARSPWSSRIGLYACGFDEFLQGNSILFDRVISNPPFYNAGIRCITSARERSRHVSGFGPMSILSAHNRILAPGGNIALVYPYADHVEVERHAASLGLACVRSMSVSGSLGAEPKRMLAEFCRNAVPGSHGSMAIETGEGGYTPEYMSLTSGFYLKF